MEFTVEDGCCFTTINGTRGTLSQACVQSLIEATKDLGSDAKYIETGSYLGCSSLIVALHSNAIVYAHDIWVTDWSELKGSPPPEVKDYFYTFYDMVKKNKMTRRIIPIRGNSVYTLGIHDDDSIDVAFIDGDHSLDGCFLDLEAVFPKMKKNGKILIHDCYGDNECRQAVLKFVAKHSLKNIKDIPYSCGMVLIEL